jgi:CO/xanthine dehydrogenase FAD-binding subunit
MIILPTGTIFRLAFDRSLRPIVSLALGLDLADGRITGGRVAIGCAYATPIVGKLPIDEALPPGELASRASAIAQEVAAGLPEPLGDHHAGASYRRRMAEVLLRRNLSALA